MDARSSDTAGDGPGYQAPLVAISDKDQTGIVIILTALGLVFGVVATLMRVYIRSELASRYQKDDFFSFSSMVFGIIQAALIFVAARWGLGKAPDLIPPAESGFWQQYLWLGDMFYFFTLFLTKCSVAFLYIRLSPNRNHVLASRLTMATSLMLTVASVITVSVRCDPIHPWLFSSEQCTGLFPRWIAVTIFHTLTEIALLGIAVYIVQGLQLPSRKKLVVMLAFAVRLPVIVPAILRLTYLSVPLSDPVSSLAFVPVVACTQIELSFAIVTTTTACLKPFMSALNTHYGGPATIKTPGGTVEGSGGRGLSGRGTAGRGTELSNLSAKSKASRAGTEAHGEKRERERKKKDTKGTEEQGGVTTWDGARYNVEVNTGPPVLEVDDVITEERESVGSSDSKKMIISKNTEWTVDFEQSRTREIV